MRSVLSVLMSLMLLCDCSLAGEPTLPLSRFSCKFTPSAIRLARDGRHLLIASPKNRVSRWDLLKKKCLVTVDLPNPDDNTLTLCPDGRRAILARYNHPLRIFDVANGKEWQIQHKVKACRAVALSRDESLLASVGYETIQLWDLNRKTVRKFSEVEGIVFSAVFFPDGKRLATATSHGVTIWDVSTGKSIQYFKAASHDAPTLTTCPLGEILAHGAIGVRTWEPRSRSPILHFTASQFSNPIRPRFTRNGLTLLLVQGGKVTLVDLVTREEIGVVLHRGKQILFDVNRRGDRLVYVDKSGQGEVFDLTLSTGQKQTMSALWDQLKSPLAKSAYQAYWKLFSMPKQTLSMLSEQLAAPPKSRESEIRQWIRELNHDDYLIRENAQQRLTQVGTDVILPLRKVTKKSITLEQRRRIRKVLKIVVPQPSQKKLRSNREDRALTLLLQLGTKESKALLQKLTTMTRKPELASKARERLRLWDRFQSAKEK